MDKSRFPLDEITLGSIRVFVSVVEAVGFSSAARHLRISVSNVSKRISDLERSVGQALLYRTTRKVQVTEAGKLFYDHCIRILGEIDGGLNSPEAEGASVRGHLRISAPPSISAELLGPHMSGFFSRYPDVTIDFFVSSSFPDVVRHRIDIAVVLREWPGNKMAHRKLSSHRRVLCASPAYLEKHGVPRTVRELARHKCLASSFSGIPEPWALYVKGKKEEFEMNIVMSSDNGDFLKKTCIDGVGIANLYFFHAREALETKDLVEVLPETDQTDCGIYVVLPHRSIATPQANAFIGYLQNLLREHLGDPGGPAFASLAGPTSVGPSAGGAVSLRQ